jgi:hypothetical protein
MKNEEWQNEELQMKNYQLQSIKGYFNGLGNTFMDLEILQWTWKYFNELKNTFMDFIKCKNDLQ